MLKKKLDPIIISLQSTELTTIEKQILTTKKVGGVILFSRNFTNKQQLIQLTSSIKDINGNVIIMVDQEGGRVWRFQNKEFKNPGAMGYLGELYNTNPEKALMKAYEIGQEIASDLVSCGIDLNLAPVLDLNHHNISTVIADRAIHYEPNIVVKIAAEFINGQKSVGIPSVGKHFPGHGAIAADSHLVTAIDNRKKAQIFNSDLEVFKKLITGDPQLNILPNTLDAVMPAHVIYPDVDPINPAGFSKIWLQDILRNSLNFKGIIISDCMSMAAAQVFVKNEFQNLTNKFLNYKFIPNNAYNMDNINDKQLNNLIATKAALDAGCNLIIFNGIHNQDLLEYLYYLDY